MIGGGAGGGIWPKRIASEQKKTNRQKLGLSQAWEEGTGG